MTKPLRRMTLQVPVVYTTEPVIYVNAATTRRDEQRWMFEYVWKNFLKIVDKMRRFFLTVFLFGLFSVSKGADSESCLVPHKSAPLATVHVSQTSSDSFLGYLVLMLAATLSIAVVMLTVLVWRYRQDNLWLRSAQRH